MSNIATMPDRFTKKRILLQVGPLAERLNTALYQATGQGVFEVEAKVLDSIPRVIVSVFDEDE